MSEAVVCNLCGADSTEPLFRLRDYRLRVDDVEWEAVRCRHCGLGYLNPRPAADEIARYYPQAYFDERAGLVGRYERETRYLPASPGRLLDVGAADGGFLRAARARGWDVVGIEPFGGADVSDVEIVSARFPEDTALPAEGFDVVTAWATFEHLHDPAAAFREAARLLRPGGRLIVQVPNLRSVWARLALQEDVPRHLYFFTPGTLRRYGEQVGLRLCRVHHTTDLCGGSGRGVLRLWLARALGRSLPQFFEIYATSRRDRFRRWPALSVAWTAAAALERVVLADRLVRALRISGQIVAEFAKAGAPA